MAGAKDMGERKIFGGNSKDMAGTKRVVGGRFHSIRIAHHQFFKSLTLLEGNIVPCTILQLIEKKPTKPPQSISE